jgi:hypothetical protein
MGKGDRNDHIRLMAHSGAGRTAEREKAVRIVEAWNVALAADRVPLFSPTLGAAFLAKRPWLRLFCPGCRQEYEIDLRKIVRSPDFPIMGLRAALTCESMCRGEGPVPKLLGLHAVPHDRNRITWDDVWGSR